MHALHSGTLEAYAELTRGTPIEAAIPLAVAAASYSTTRAGAMSSYLTENELFALISSPAGAT